MKKSFMLFVMLVFVVEFMAISRNYYDNIDNYPKEIRKKLEEAISANDFSKLNDEEKLNAYAYKYWRDDSYKNLNKIHVNASAIILDLKSTSIIVNGVKYFCPSHLPVSHKDIGKKDNLKVYSLFNSVYFIEKDFTPPIIPEWLRPWLFAGGVSIIPPILASSYHSKYDDATSSSDAKSFKGSAKMWGTASYIVPVAAFAYPIYKTFFKKEKQ